MSLRITLSKFCGSEFVRKYRLASPLICVFMSKILFSWNLLPLYRVMSRNVSLLGLISCVNFMVSCI